MNQNRNRGKQLSNLAGGRGINLSSSAESSSMPSSYCTTDNSDDNNGDNNQNQGCLGGCLGGWLGHGGGGDALAAAADSSNGPDPALLTAEELNKLSLKEREIVYEDLHGVSMVEDESNEDLVNKRLNEMKSELENIPSSKKVAYLIAMEEFGDIGKDFCQSRSLHLMFLRADRWDSKKAATRFVGWMDWKLELFGRKVLCHRHITLDKLSKNSRATVQSGLTQILPQRDTSGRTVIFDNIGRQAGCTVKSILQQFWYTNMAVVEDDIHSQRLGIVYILYAVDGASSFSADDLKIMYDSGRIAPMLPVRVGSIHYCFNDPTMRPVISLIQKAIGSHLRARFRSHEGKHTEVQYSLMSYGIPADLLPITTDGKIQKTHHLKWCKRRKTRDAELTNLVGGGHENDFFGIDLPGRFDVLLGKGRPIQNSLGNRRLQELISIYAQEYDAGIYGEKQLIADKIVKLVPDPCSEVVLPVMGGQQSHNNGIVDNTSNVVRAGAPRFLKRRDDGWWEPVSHQEAVEKVCHSFRALRFANAKKTRSVNSRTTRTTSSSIVHRTTTGEVTNLALTTSSGDTASAGDAKRVKVDTQNIVEQEIPALNLSEPSLSILDEGDREEEEEEEEKELENSTLDIDTPNNATTTEDDELLLDLDGFDW